MAIASKVGSFNWNAADVVGTTYTVSSLSFAPQFVFLWTSGRAGASDSAGTAGAVRMMGMFSETSSRRGIGFWSADNVETSQTARAHSDVACLVHPNSTGSSISGGLDADAMLADGFRLIVDAQTGADHRIHYWAVGGLTNIFLGTFNAPSVAGDQDITDPNFQPDAVLCIGAMINANPPGAQAHSTIALGVAAGVVPTNLCLSTASLNGLASSRTSSYCRIGQFYAGLSGATNPISTAELASVTTWLSNGFRLNWSEVLGTENRRVFYAALKGGAHEVGSFTTRTDTTQFFRSTAFPPVAALFLSHCLPESASDTPQNHDVWSVGAATSGSERASHGVIDEHDVPTTDVGTAVEHDEIYINLNTAMTIEGLGDLASFASNGMDLVMDDADLGANFVGYWAIGDSALPPVHRVRQNTLARL